MTLSQVYLAQARLSHSGPEVAWETLTPVFAIPDEQRIPQTAQALNRLRQQLRTTACANLPAARDLDEAILDFHPAAESQERHGRLRVGGESASAPRTPNHLPDRYSRPQLHTQRHSRFQRDIGVH